MPSLVRVQFSSLGQTLELHTAKGYRMPSTACSCQSGVSRSSTSEVVNPYSVAWCWSVTWTGPGHRDRPPHMHSPPHSCFEHACTCQYRHEHSPALSHICPRVCTHAPQTLRGGFPLPQRLSQSTVPKRLGTAALHPWEGPRSSWIGRLGSQTCGLRGFLGELLVKRLYKQFCCSRFALCHAHLFLKAV